MAKYWTDFSEYKVGEKPSDWTERWLTDATPTVEVQSGSEGGKVLQLPIAPFANPRGLTWDKIDSDPDRADYEILWLSKQPSYTDHHTCGRASGLTSGDHDSIRHGWDLKNAATNNFTFLEFTNGSYSNVQYQSTGKSFNNTQWVWQRIRVIGTQVQMKIWEKGTPEPTAWGYNENFVGLSQAGSIGIERFADELSYVDVFSVATNGETAPMENPDNVGHFSIKNNSTLLTDSGHDNLAVDLSQIDVPLEFWERVKYDGGNIRVYHWDETTEKAVAREVSGFDKANKQGIIYFDSSDALALQENEWRIKAEANLEEPAYADPLGRNAVWANQKMVHHLSDGTPSSVFDSSGNNHDGAKSIADDPLEVSGKLGKGQKTQTSGQAINYGSGASLVDLWQGGGSLKFWFKADSYGDLSGWASGSHLISPAGMGIYIHSDRLQFDRTFSTQYGSWQTPTGSVSLNA